MVRGIEPGKVASISALALGALISKYNSYAEQGRRCAHSGTSRTLRQNRNCILHQPFGKFQILRNAALLVSYVSQWIRIAPLALRYAISGCFAPEIRAEIEAWGNRGFPVAELFKPMGLKAQSPMFIGLRSEFRAPQL